MDARQTGELTQGQTRLGLVVLNQKRWPVVVVLEIVHPPWSGRSGNLTAIPSDIAITGKPA